MESNGPFEWLVGFQVNTVAEPTVVDTPDGQGKPVALSLALNGHPPFVITPATAQALAAALQQQIARVNGTSLLS